MDRFIDALLSGKTDRIPEEYDWFAPLLGDWDCDYYDEPTEGYKRHVKGEWIFRRILEGTGVQDIFIFPSRATKETEPQPDGEYGSSLRMFNKVEHCYDVVYTLLHNQFFKKRKAQITYRPTKYFGDTEKCGYLHTK